jgi:acylphosphatase
MEEKLLYKIQVTGRVQGVGFRWRAASEARNRNLKGFVKNLSNGSVYIEAEGPIDELEIFVEWCRKGPGYALVETINVDALPPVNHKDFRIES